MPTNLTVTPGTTFVAGTLVTPAVLNLAATPTVTIADGSLDADAIDAASFVAAFGGAFRGVNYLPWSNFNFDAFRPSAVTCPDGQKTAPLEGWHVQPTSADVQAERDSSVPDTASGYSLKVSGAVGLTFVRLGTYLPPSVTNIAQGTVVFSAYIYNSTGLSFTPSLEVLTSAVAGDEGNLDAPVTVAGQACANAAWTRVQFEISTAVVTAAAWKRGAHLCIKITAGGGVMDLTGDYVLLAQAQLDKTALQATWLPTIPVRNPFPAGMLVPWAGASTTVPNGWLYCDGTAVSRTSYRALFDIIGTAYGAGDGSTTFNLPDLRGRAFIGAEVSGDSEERTQKTVACTGTISTATLTVATTAGLRLGMGAFAATGVPTGAYIIGLTDTVITLSTNLTATITGVSVRFGRMGPTGDPEVVGKSGEGASYGKNEIRITKKGCTTAGTTTLTVPHIDKLACGMKVSSSAGDIPDGTTIVAFLSATSVKLSAAAGSATAATHLVTFSIVAPEGNAFEIYEHLKANPTILCVINLAADALIQLTGMTFLVEPGMSISGPAGAGLNANAYVLSYYIGGPSDFLDITITSGATPASYELVFSGSSMARAATPVPDMLPATVGNYIIKY